MTTKGDMGGFAAQSEAQLLKDLKKANERINQLCGMVNSYSVQLGLGKKVNAEDWML